MKRRLLATFLSLCLLVGLLPTVALAEESPASETQGESSEQQATATDSTFEATTDLLSGNSTDGTMSGTCGATEQDNVRWTLATPTRTGYTFQGWYTTADFVDSTKVTDNTATPGQTYYAKWEIETDTSWYGDGTADTYLISNVAQLAGLAKLVNGGCNFDGKTVELSADINLNNMDWKAIGTLDKPFKGEFDGNGHLISNFIISDSAATYQGLFGYCESANIHDFNMTGIDIECDYRGGIVAGVAAGSAFANIKISDSTIDGRGHIGGLIGRVQTMSAGDSTVTVTNCDMENVSVSAMSVAGSWNDTVNNAEENNKVDSTTPFSTRCGGITSITVNAPLVISGCDLENVTVKSWGYSGGMVGVAYGASATVSIERSSFSGTVDSKSGGATAGLATGSNNAEITVDNCRVEATLDGNEVEELQENCEYPFISTGTVKNSTADVIFTRNATIFPSSDSTTLNESAEDCTVNAKFAAGIAQQSFLGYTVYTQSTTFENCAVTVELTDNVTDVTLSAYRRGNHDSNKNKNNTYVGCTLLISADDMSSISVETGVGGASPLYVDFNLPVTITPSKTLKVTDANTIAVLNGGTFAEGTEFTSGTLATPIKDGAIFAGWYEDSSFSGSPVTSATAGQTYYAKWIDLGITDISLQYQGTQALPTAPNGVTYSDWKSEASSIVSIENNQLKANKVGETTITATATYNGNTAEVSVPVEVTPRVLTYTLADGDTGSGSITYNYSGGHHALTDSLTFKWADEPGTEVTLVEGTDINYTYAVSSENGGDGTPRTYDYLPMPVGTYNDVQFNLLNENYTFALSGEESTGKTLEIDVVVQAEGTQRAYLASAAPKDDQNFVYTGEDVLPVEGTLNAYEQDNTSSDTVDIGTFTINIEGLNGTSFNSEVSEIPAGTDLSAITDLALPTEPGTYIITASAASETHYLYKSLVFTISKATVTIKADDKTIYVGDDLPEWTYTVSGLASGESLSETVSLSCDAADTNTAGTYTITPSGAAVPDTNHYNSEIVYQPGTLTILSRGGGGGGGSSSGGSSSSNVSGSGDDVSISASGGSVTVSQMESAVKKADEGATITIKATGSSKISLPASGLESAADNDNSLTLDLRYGEVTLSPDALSAVADQAGSTVTMTVAPVDTDELNSRQQAAVGDAPVFDLTIRSGSTVISDFDGGLATVSIPYELPSNQDPAGVVVWFLDDDGNITPCETMYDTRTETVIFTTRHFSKYVIGYEEPTVFTDVSEDAYYADAVLWAVANGVTNGTSATTFSPDMAVTRAQAVTFQWRAAGSPVVSGSSFGDVAADAYYVNAVTWAVANGITNGTSATTFSPDVVVSRAQAVTFLHRELG